MSLLNFKVKLSAEIKKKYSFEEGGFKEMAYTAVPLILAYFSSSMMLFSDRLILAHYSFSAMNAAAAAGIICTVFIFGALGIASISEVFVGQFNGAKKFDQIGPAVWQMLWFSLFTVPFFFFIATFTGKYLLAHIDFEEHGNPYFQWLLYSGPFFAFNAALTGFFIGLGKVRLITALAFLGNAINILLDYFLVFGSPVYNIPSLGAKGAAIATGISQICISLVLLIIFLRKKNCQIYHTRESAFNPLFFWHSVKVGAPAGLSHVMEMTAWAAIYQLCILTSAMHITLMAFGQSFYSIILFCLEGMNKAVTAIAANLIGARKWQLVSKTFFSGFQLLLILYGVSSIILVIYPEFLIRIFLEKVDNTEEYAYLFGQLKLVSLFVWFYFLFDGIAWISSGIITAAEDTLFLMSVNAFSAWVVAFVPSYYIIYKWHLNPIFCWVIFVAYAFFNGICFFLRYRWLLKRSLAYNNKP